MRALLLMAHGSRRAEANDDLRHVAEQIDARGGYKIVQVSFLELAEPSIPEGGELCVKAGATEVIMLPYFLSPGVHMVRDMKELHAKLVEQFPAVHFYLAAPLGPHPYLLDIIEQRANEAIPEGGI